MENDTEEGDIINLIIDQIEFCNLIILNKTDLLGSEQIEEVTKAIRDIQSEAEIIPAVTAKSIQTRYFTAEISTIILSLLHRPFSVRSTPMSPPTRKRVWTNTV
jgi:hypothetical protein